MGGGGGGGEGWNLKIGPENPRIFVTFLIIITPPPPPPPLLASALVFLVPYCCLFCVLSNTILNVSIGTFS